MLFRASARRPLGLERPHVVSGAWIVSIEINTGEREVVLMFLWLSAMDRCTESMKNVVKRDCHEKFPLRTAWGIRN